MQTFFAYNFLQSLAVALLNSLWQMAFLWIVFCVAKNFLQLSTKSTYRGLVLTHISGFLWLIYTFATALSSPQMTYNYNFFGTNLPTTFEKFLPLLSVIYLFFVTVFIAKFFIQLNTIRNLKTNAIIDISNKWQKFVTDTANLLQIKKNVVVKISKTITTPLTIGFLKPIILIPIASLNNLTATQLEAVLLHELAHIKRQDYIINLVLMVIDTLMFFNPFSNCISKQISIEREMCCDDIVLKRNYSSATYAEALLRIATSQLQLQPVYGALPAVSSNHQLRDRVKRIISVEIEKTNFIWTSKQVIFSTSFGAILFLLIGFINSNVNTIVNQNISFVTNNTTTSNTFTKKTTFKKAVAKSDFTKKQSIKNKKIFRKKIDLKNNTIALTENREALKKGLEFIGKLATENNNTNVFASTNEKLENTINADEQNIINIAPAVDKHPTTTVQRYFIPATSKSTASIIVVTTTEKEDGKKIVTIDIEKGKSKVE